MSYYYGYRGRPSKFQEYDLFILTSLAKTAKYRGKKGRVWKELKRKAKTVEIDGERYQSCTYPSEISSEATTQQLTSFINDGNVIVSRYGNVKYSRNKSIIGKSLKQARQIMRDKLNHRGESNSISEPKEINESFVFKPNDEIYCANIEAEIDNKSGPVYDSWNLLTSLTLVEKNGRLEAESSVLYKYLIAAGAKKEHILMFAKANWIIVLRDGEVMAGLGEKAKTLEPEKKSTNNDETLSENPTTEDLLDYLDNLINGGDDSQNQSDNESGKNGQESENDNNNDSKKESDLEADNDVDDSHKESENDINLDTENESENNDQEPEIDLDENDQESENDVDDSQQELDNDSDLKRDFIVPRQYQRLLDLVTIRQNILMTGPTGCGKTFIAIKLAEELGLQFRMVSCYEGMSESYLMGWLIPVDNGNMEYIPSGFVDCFENGGLFLLDEIDAADANVLQTLNSCLANGILELPKRIHGEKQIKKHKDCVIMAAANTVCMGQSNSNYTARNQLDMATINRFHAGIVEMDYDPRVERELINPIVLEWGLSIRKWIDNQNRIRSQGNSPELPYTMSTRTMRDYTIQKNKLNYGKKEWEESYFSIWSIDDREKCQTYIRRQRRMEGRF